MTPADAVRLAFGVLNVGFGVFAALAVALMVSCAVIVGVVLNHAREVKAHG